MRVDGHDTGSIAPIRIVAIRPGALGDTLLLFPTLALLRRAFPSTRIILVSRPDVESLAWTSGLIDGTLSYDDPRWATFFTDSPPEDSPARDVLAGATALAWLVDPDGSVARNLKALGATQAFILPPKPLANSRKHVALQLSYVLPLLGVEAPTSITTLGAAMPPLRLDAEAERVAYRVWQRLGLPDGSTSVVAIHPGSGGAAKRWPPERFAELVSSIRQMGFSPLLLEGTHDAELAGIIAANTGEKPLIARGLSVSALGALLRRCTVYVGNDSGVTHLAGMLGVRTLALFGPTDPALWAPLGPHVRITRAKDGRMESLSTLEVQEALAALLHA